LPSLLEVLQGKEPFVGPVSAAEYVENESNDVTFDFRPLFRAAFSSTAATLRQWTAIRHVTSSNGLDLRERRHHREQDGTNLRSVGPCVGHESISNPSRWFFKAALLS